MTTFRHAEFQILYMENSSRHVEEADGNGSLISIKEIITVKIYYSTRINKVSGCLESTYNTHL